MVNWVLKYRIYADQEVESFFARICGTVRLVYNVALEQRSSHWRQFKRSEGRHLPYPSQARELTAIRAEYDWVAECPIDAQQQALRDLDQAFRNFFTGRAGYPGPRRKFVNDAFRIPASRIGEIEVLNRKWARIRLPKIGMVKFRYTRPVRGEVGNVTVTREANGWHIVFACSFEHEVPANDNPSVGIDRGIVNNVALSTGEMFSMPDSTDLVERHKRWQHVVTTRVARRFSTVVFENLKTRNMMASAAGTVEEPGTNVAQKRGLNRSIAGASWFQFETFQTYKSEFLGDSVVKIDPRHTSVTCARCGSRDKGNRENQAKFLCLSCGHSDHADVNAAVNIHKAGTRPSDTCRATPGSG